MLQILLGRKWEEVFLQGAKKLLPLQNVICRYCRFPSMPKVLCMVALLPVTHISEAAVREHLVYSYYKVRANPSRPLSIILNEASPRHENDLVFHGFTVWKVKWRYQNRVGADGRCGIKNFRTYLYADIDLPSLSGAAGTQEEQFEQYLVALHAHELGHYSIGKEAALAFDKSMHAIHAKRSCNVLASSVKRLADKIADRYHNLELQYDTSTKNGKLQGAQLDW